MIDEIVHIINTWEIETLYFFVIEWIWLLFFVIMIALKINMWKSIFKLKKNMEYQYDTIIYYSAKFQQENKQAKINTYLMDLLFNLSNSNYIDNYQLIVSSIKWLNDSLWQKVVPEKELTKLVKLNRKLKFEKILKTILAVLAIIAFVLMLALYIRVYIIK